MMMPFQLVTAFLLHIFTAIDFSRRHSFSFSSSRFDMAASARDRHAIAADADATLR